MLHFCAVQNVDVSALIGDADGEESSGRAGGEGQRCEDED